MMKRILLTVLLLLAGSAWSADDSVFGTHWVKFEPFQVAGQLKGCSLVYLAVQADRVYMNGDEVAVNGAISYRITDGNRLAIIFKVGLKNISKNSPFERPYFAYLQTANGSTAGATQEAFDGDDGYKIFVYSATEAVVQKVFSELLATSMVTIGYNRRGGGADVLLPLDLMIVDAEYTKEKKVIRKSEPSTVLGFTNCLTTVLDAVTKEFDKK